VPARFDADSEVEGLGDGRYEGRVDRGWWITHGPNGGYLAAILLRAATMHLADDGRPPALLTTHFVRPAREGRIVMGVVVERAGRSLRTVTVRAHQDDELVAMATVAFAAPRATPVEFVDLAPPPVAPPEACPEWPPPAAPVLVPINERYEQRWAIGDPPARVPAPPDRPGPVISGGWLRTEDARNVDHALAAAFADGWVPPIFGRTGPGVVGVPTVELTVHFRGGLPRPAGEYVLGVFRSRVAMGGFVEEDGELWAEDGTLIAQSRQLSVIVDAAP
jgi:acyl-CoA thioesterase